MVVSLADYLKQGVDKTTSNGMYAAIADAANAWAQLDKDKITPEKAKELARDAIKNEALFLAPAGTKELAGKYTEVLIARSEELDKKQGKKPGADLMAYMDEVSAAIRKEYKTPEEYQAAKDRVQAAIKNPLKGLDPKFQEDLKKFQRIKADVSKAAKEHFGMQGSVEEDFRKTLESQKKEFEGVKINDPAPEVKNQQSPLMMIVMLLFAVLAGGNIGELMKGFSQQAQKTEQQPEATASPQPKQKTDEPAQKKPTDAEIKAFAADMPKMAEAGKKILKAIPGGEMLGALAVAVFGGKSQTRATGK